MLSFLSVNLYVVIISGVLVISNKIKSYNNLIIFPRVVALFQVHTVS